MSILSRIEIRKKIHDAGKELFNGLGNNLYLQSLQYLTGEILANNEEYVLNHQGEEESYATLEILKTGFTVNQKDWILDLKDMLNRLREEG